MIKNFEDIDYYSFRDTIINHEKMDEETLFKLCECENNQILSQILLSSKVRISSKPVFARRVVNSSQSAIPS